MLFLFWDGGEGGNFCCGFGFYCGEAVEVCDFERGNHLGRGDVTDGGLKEGYAMKFWRCCGIADKVVPVYINCVEY